MNIHIKNSHVQFTILMHSITELEIEILFLWESSLLFESVFDPLSAALLGLGSFTNKTVAKLCRTSVGRNDNKDFV